MRRLTMRQAVSCESATGKRCKCRCGGLAHGRGRIFAPVTDAMIMALPEDDPHHAQPPKPRPTRRERQEAAGQLVIW
jgi:hypothetical protein